MTLPQPWDIVNETQVVQDNLEPVVKFWKEEANAQPRVRDIFEAAIRSGQTDTQRLIVIRNGVITFPLMPPGLNQFECDQRCNPQLTAFLDAMREAARTYGLKLPDVVFNLNVQDGGGPPCSRNEVRQRDCAAPALSLSKPDHSMNILGPMMLLPDANVTWHHAPRAKKAPRVFFRGSPTCGAMTLDPPACARTWVARLAQQRPDVLDAGIVEAFKQTKEEMAEDPILKDGKGPLPVLHRAPRSTLALHKYLLNLDGITAAYRFATLLGTNSLVLKQDSQQLEWFYGSVKPWEHYLPVLLHNTTDILDQVAWADKHPDDVARMVGNANRFALTYTTYYGRILYWIYALEAYRGLFKDQARFFKTHGAEVRDLVQSYQRDRVKEQGVEGVLRQALQDQGGVT